MRGRRQIDTAAFVASDVRIRLQPDHNRSRAASRCTPRRRLSGATLSAKETELRANQRSLHTNDRGGQVACAVTNITPEQAEAADAVLHSCCRDVPREPMVSFVEDDHRLAQIRTTLSSRSLRRTS